MYSPRIMYWLSRDINNSSHITDIDLYDLRDKKKLISRVVSISPKWFIIILSMIFIAALIGSMQPYVVKLIIDQLTIITPNMNALFANWYLCLWLGLVLLLEPMIWSSTGILGSQLFTRARGQIRKDLFTYALGHSRNYFENTYTGALATKIKTAGDAIDEMLCLTSWSFLPLIFRLCIITTAYLFTQPIFSLVLLAGIVTYFMVITHIGRKVEYHEKRFSSGARSPCSFRCRDEWRYCT